MGNTKQRRVVWCGAVLTRFPDVRTYQISRGMVECGCLPCGVVDEYHADVATWPSKSHWRIIRRLRQRAERSREPAPREAAETRGGHDTLSCPPREESANSPSVLLPVEACGKRSARGPTTSCKRLVRHCILHEWKDWAGCFACQDARERALARPRLTGPLKRGDAQLDSISPARSRLRRPISLTAQDDEDRLTQRRASIPRAGGLHQVVVQTSPLHWLSYRAEGGRGGRSRNRIRDARR